MIYSVIPDEMIMRNEEDNPTIQEIEYLGFNLEVCEISPSTYQIHRVLTTDLGAYLNPQLQPGNIIEKKLK